MTGVPPKNRLRIDAWAVFGRRCGVRCGEVATYGVELVSIDDALDAVIMRDSRGVACVVVYADEVLCGVFARHVVGDLVA